MNIISVCHQNLLVSGHKKAAAELVLHCKQLPSAYKFLLVNKIVGERYMNGRLRKERWSTMGMKSS